MHFTPLSYLDPGSGSFLIQMLIAALLGIGVALRASWSKIKGRFGILGDMVLRATATLILQEFTKRLHKGLGEQG